MQSKDDCAYSEKSVNGKFINFSLAQNFILFKLSKITIQKSIFKANYQNKSEEFVRAQFIT